MLARPARYLMWTGTAIAAFAGAPPTLLILACAVLFAMRPREVWQI